MKKTLIFFLVVAGAVGLIYFFVAGNNGSSAGTGVDVSKSFDSKVVYTQDVGQDPAPFRKDCKSRGGEFQECGSICGPDADMCAEVCAYTCVNIPEGESTSTNTSDSTSTAGTTSSMENSTGSASGQ